MINIGNVLSVRVPTLIHSALWQLGDRNVHFT
jgi:hypothetical protein